MERNTISRMELHFWNFAIKALSGSLMVRPLVRKLAVRISESEAASMGILLGITGAAGLVTGYLFFFLVY